MKWLKISLKTKAEAVDYISSLFDDLGFEGIQIEDCAPLDEDNGNVVVSTYIKPDGRTKVHIEAIRLGLAEIAVYADVGEGVVRADDADDTEWIDNWKEFFKPFRVADNIIIKPTWEAYEKETGGDIVVEIDPGTAFGTGSHETTRLCIEALRKHVSPRMKLLDVGCGSGILSIIGLLLGAERADGTDIDPAAVTATADNMAANGITADRYRVIQGDIIGENKVREWAGAGEYDIITSNILASVLIPLTGVIGRYLKRDGLLVLSGIYRDMTEAVKTALIENSFNIHEMNVIGDWTSITAAKRN